jgi:hypothetical protein
MSADTAEEHELDPFFGLSKAEEDFVENLVWGCSVEDAAEFAGFDADHGDALLDVPCIYVTIVRAVDNLYGVLRSAGYNPQLPIIVPPEVASGNVVLFPSR